MNKQPIIIVNAKTYSQSTGKAAQRLAQACDRVASNGAYIGLALQAFDLKTPLDNAVMFAQHLDCGEPGRNTGYLIAKNAKTIGVKGTILNHSEHKIPFETLKKIVLECKEQKLVVVLCADSAQEAKQLVSLRPDYIAVEPPELIGGDVSVTTKPEIIVESVRATGDTPLLVGAGVKTRADVQKALELGAVGVLVASGVVLSQDPTRTLKEFLE